MQTVKHLFRRKALRSEPVGKPGKFPGGHFLHVHLPFLVAATGGSLGGGRWAVRLARMIAAFFCAVNRTNV